MARRIDLDARGGGEDITDFLPDEILLLPNTAGCETADEAVRVAGELQDIFGKEYFYVELMDHGLDIETRTLKDLMRLAETIGAPVYVEFVPNSASFPASHPLYRGAMTRSQAGVRAAASPTRVRVASSCASTKRRTSVPGSTRSTRRLATQPVDTSPTAFTPNATP